MGSQAEVLCLLVDLLGTKSRLAIGSAAATEQSGGGARPTKAQILAAWRAVGVSRACPSWDRSILAEIYRCRACSDHEVEDKTPGQEPGFAWECRPGQLVQEVVRELLLMQTVRLAS
jgi:hypothetical protein